MVTFKALDQHPRMRNSLTVFGCGAQQESW